MWILQLNFSLNLTAWLKRRKITSKVFICLLKYKKEDFLKLLECVCASVMCTQHQLFLCTSYVKCEEVSLSLRLLYTALLTMDFKGEWAVVLYEKTPLILPKIWWILPSFLNKSSSGLFYIFKYFFIKGNPGFN